MSWRMAEARARPRGVGRGPRGGAVPRREGQRPRKVLHLHHLPGEYTVTHLVDENLRSH